MKKNCITAPRESYLYLAESLVLMVLLTLKLIFFNNYIKLGAYSYVISAATLLLVGVIWLILSRFKSRNPVNFLFTIYIIASVLMLIDRMYFSYLNKLPSVIALKLLGYLGSVGDSVGNLFTLNQAMYVLDIPVIFIYLLYWRRKAAYLLRCARFNSVKLNIKKLSTIVSAAFCALCLVFIGRTLTTDNFQLQYLKNELFTYHITDVISVIKSTTVEREIDTGEYIPAIKPTEDEAADAPYWGIASGMNLVNIQVEAMQAFVLNRTYNGQEITPFLNKLLADDTLYFDNYYYQIGGGNTSDAEFAVNNSLFTPDSEAAYDKYTTNDYFGLPFIFKANGYSGAHAFHGYYGDFWNRRTAYVYQGFDDFHAREDLSEDDLLGLGVSDKSFFSQALDIMTTYEEPFYTFMVTLSSHHPYNIPEELWGLELEPQHVGTLFGNYLEAMNYVDSAFELFFEGLKEKGLYDNTVVTIYGDHFGLPNYDWYSKYYMSELLGHEYYENDIYKVPLIVHIPGIGESTTFSVTGGHIDYMPTMLYLFGLENTKSVMFGQNLITATSGITYEQTHMARGSFISDDVIFVYPTSGILVNAHTYDKKTGEAIPSTGYDDICKAAIKAYEDCNSLLEKNMILLDKQ